MKVWIRVWTRTRGRGGEWGEERGRGGKGREGLG